MKGPDIEEYLALFRLYEEVLGRPTRAGGNALEFPFERVMRLLSNASAFNDTLPLPFRDVARRWVAGEEAAHSHFGHDENRQFFLSDLRDHLRMQAARRRTAVQK